MNDFIAILIIVFLVFGFIALVTVIVAKANEAIEEAAEYHRKINE